MNNMIRVFDSFRLTRMTGLDCARWSLPGKPLLGNIAKAFLPVPDSGRGLHILRNPTWIGRGLSTTPFEPAKERVVQEKNEDPIRRIRTIIQRRTSDPESEFARLKKIERIDRSLEKITKHSALNLEEQVAVAQSIELREELQSDFYVVNHGQRNSGIIVNIVAKKAAELFQSRKFECFEILRDELFLREIPKDRDVTWYKNRLGVSGFFDRNCRNELICGDIAFENITRSESAIHFFSRGQNIAVCENPLFIPNLLTKILQKHFSEALFAESVLKELWEISKDLKGGTLYSICIPKKKFSSLAYFSMAGGIPFKNPSHFNLESLQNGTSSDRSEIPQVRLLTSKLTEQEGILIIPHSGLPRGELDRIEQAVRDCLLHAAKRYPVQGFGKR